MLALLRDLIPYEDERDLELGYNSPRGLALILKIIEMGLAYELVQEDRASDLKLAQWERQQVQQEQEREQQTDQANQALAAKVRQMIADGSLIQRLEGGNDGLHALVGMLLKIDPDTDKTADLSV
jgi:hypothetical protein